MSLALPTTALAIAARNVIDAELEAPLRNHSLRSFLFGRALAAAQGLRAGRDYDEELMYLICALHDIGLADAADGDQRFEVDGADYAAEFLEGRGVTDERVDIVWDAIAAHSSGLCFSPVYRRRRPAAIWIAVEGIGADIGGAPDTLAPDFADEVHAAFPRLGGIRALADAIAAQAIAKPHKALPGSLPGEIVRLRHPELVPTWNDIVGANGWKD
ncbi:HD domain-containing protein [Nocardia sp. NPDC024068]|uniref:HD domain-containing protein n=1 Tax=Nocardia sp. NPDC024068 TaxID=3157197 RepID=UPI0033E1C961